MKSKEEIEVMANDFVSLAFNKQDLYDGFINGYTQGSLDMANVDKWTFEEILDACYPTLGRGSDWCDIVKRLREQKLNKAIKQNEGKLFNEKGEMLVYKKQSDTSSIYDVDVYEPRKTDVEEYSKFKYCKREKNGRECVYRLDKKALLEMIKKEKFIYSNGGGVNQLAEDIVEELKEWLNQS